MKPTLTLVKNGSVVKTPAAGAPVSAYAARPENVAGDVSSLQAASRRLSAAFSGSFATAAGLKQARALALEAAALANRIAAALS